ncbi:hypothetical protein FPV67DRAFT_1667278 [Lyophyllum atratum]|nr:hypothetical protein FPV67DRAFT_1667278 [Lyophyllum atratum]
MASTPEKTSEKVETPNSTEDLAGDAPFQDTAPGSHVVFEDYLHYAAIQRRFEDGHLTPEAPEKKRNWMSKLSDHKGPNINVDVRSASNPNVSEENTERINALRALRTASWASVFYLITTDILGPFNAPYAISQVGWVPGILLYFFMGLAALYTGLILWRLYIRLDSLKYPLKTYADIAERIFGRTARHVCTVLQSLQLIVNLCFSICILIWVLLGMVVGQIRTLKNFGWLANSAVWLNLLIIFISMGVVAHSPPNFEAAKKSLNVDPGPVVTAAFVKLPLFNKINGIMNMVFAYGGAMIFPEIMAEMRRPMDFWKGMAMAQGLIFSAYLLFGAFFYAFQGQFTLPLAYQGLSIFAWQTVGNSISLVTGIIAAGLYGNIGIKVAYTNIVEDWFKGPPLMSRKGRVIWSTMVIAYWALAFIIGSAIPQVQTITGLIAAIAIMQFSYTFPLFLRVGYDVITDAMTADEAFAPGKGASGRVDNWSQWSRWKRGLFSGRWYFKLLNLVLGLGALAMACLGMWGAGESIKAVFANSAAATSFGCSPPV